MKSSFTNVAANTTSRKFGGYKTGVADPYITGYHFIWFKNFPSVIDTTDTPAGTINTNDMKSLLSGLCMSVTPPGGTLNKVEFTGLGGTKWAVPGGIDYGNSVSVKFTEMQSLPVSSIMHAWVKKIRDYRYGLTSITEDEANQYTKENYSATMYYWTTAPDGYSIEYYACYDGMFPSKDPQDLFSSDIETIGKLEVEIEFNVDYAWHEPWVKDNIEKEMANVITTGKIDAINDYGKKDS